MCVYIYIRLRLVLGKEGGRKAARKESSFKFIVLKPDSDRPIGPVEPGTGGMTGLSGKLDQPCYQTGVNRRESEKPVTRPDRTEPSLSIF